MICSTSDNVPIPNIPEGQIIAFYLKVHGFHFVLDGMGFPHQFQH